MVSVTPGRFLGYHHPSGEVHIMDDDQWLSCPGKKFCFVELKKKYVIWL